MLLTCHIKGSEIVKMIFIITSMRPTCHILLLFRNFVASTNDLSSRSTITDQPSNLNLTASANDGKTILRWSALLCDCLSVPNRKLHLPFNVTCRKLLSRVQYTYLHAAHTITNTKYVISRLCLQSSEFVCKRMKRCWRVFNIIHALLVRKGVFSGFGYCSYVAIITSYNGNERNGCYSNKT